ncbi:MAG: endonuclease [Bacteroidetes bacterium]|nr:endonuclease [Bacteroidota bacterium]
MKLLFISTILLFTYGCAVSQKKSESIAFYNVENLFDAEDGPNDDSEFLPDGKNQWTTERYEKKLANINKVLGDLSYPMLVGFCEIENEGVLKDLISRDNNLSNYGTIHYESPDARGIDVGFIYNKSKLSVIGSGKIRFTLPGDSEPKSRDIVWGKFLAKKDTILALVNHWPSRRTENSEPKRIKAAESARVFIDSVLKVNPTSKIVFMGDLNDHPSDKAPQLISARLSPMISEACGEFGGTHQYKNEWNVIDHIMVSPGFKKGKVKVLSNSGKIHSFSYLIEEYKGNKQPFKTYAGAKYLGGFSDHLPVSVQVKLK